MTYKVTIKADWRDDPYVYVYEDFADALAEFAASITDEAHLSAKLSFKRGK